MNLADAQAARIARVSEPRVDVWLAEIKDPVAKRKLKGILAKYRKSPHPFRACVKDNLKRFGPGRTEAVCATLKDTIEHTTKWRKGGGHAHMSEYAGPVVDADVLLALDVMAKGALGEAFLAFAEAETGELALSSADDELRAYGDKETA
jgi:hypothetical protein